MESTIGQARALPHAQAAEAARLGDYLRLAKPGVGLLLVFTAVTAGVVARTGTAVHLVLLALAGSLACAGSGALNHYLEQDVDALMSRTSRRPLPSGRVTPGRALAMGLVLLGLAMVLSLGINALTSLFILLGAFVYVVVYTWWLKRRSPWNIIIGGSAGSLGVLAGWSAATGGVGATALAMALLVFVWTPLHFWSFAIVHEEEYRRARIPMLPVLVGARATARWASLHGVLAVAVSLFLLGESFGGVYVTMVTLAGLGLLVVVTWLNAAPSIARARATFLASNVYLALLFAAMLADVLL